MDIRSHGKEFDRFYEGAKAKGVRFVRARPHSIEPGPGQRRRRRCATSTEDGRMQGRGLRPGGAVDRHGARRRRPATWPRSSSIELDHYRLRASTSDFAPVTTNRAGVFVGRRLPGPQGHPALGRRSLDRGLRGGRDADRRRAASSTQHEDLSGRAQRGRRTRCASASSSAPAASTSPASSTWTRSPSTPGRCRTWCCAENNLFSCSADTQELMAKKIARAPPEPRRDRGLHAAHPRAALPGHAA
ncbi:MAG: hypothetical protein MZV70_48495 [Desulfobacterales bacterium]|nr:hypothetical protein [Desulfobacterales bacterium]